MVSGEMYTIVREAISSPRDWQNRARSPILPSLDMYQPFEGYFLSGDTPFPVGTAPGDAYIERTTSSEATEV